MAGRFRLFVIPFFIFALMLSPTAAKADFSLGISVNFGPPALPYYVQPVCPEPNLIWTPGYWAYGAVGYFWVPGTWVRAPRPGYLWTPGYWGYAGGSYGWNPGYWATHVGFYGGIDYGYGYGGFGYGGGRWEGGGFRYNTAVTNVNTTIVRNVYIDRTVVNNDNITNNMTTNITRNVSYVGGPGGIVARPRAAELAVRNEEHVAPTGLQVRHERFAARDRNALAAINGGQSKTLAIERPLSRENRPTGFEEIRPADRVLVQRQLQTRGAPLRASLEHGVVPRPAGPGVENGALGATPTQTANPFDRPHGVLTSRPIPSRPIRASVSHCESTRRSAERRHTETTACGSGPTASAACSASAASAA